MKPQDIVSTESAVQEVKKVPAADKLSVEFFHIYTNELINGRHTRGLEYLKTIEKTWKFAYERILLIDNYNPPDHNLTAEDVLSYLESHGMQADHWAYEGDLVVHAQQLLELITSPKLKRSYENYIKKNNKYPCSLLTAAWYLTRLGRFPHKDIIHATHGSPPYQVADRLLNILPEDYKAVENRTRRIILRTEFAEDADKIQDLFYPTDSNQALDLF